MKYMNISTRKPRTRLGPQANPNAKMKASILQLSVMIILKKKTPF